MSEPLEPCRDCGAEARMIPPSSRGFFYVECANHHRTTREGLYSTFIRESAAITAWNTRATKEGT